MSRAPRFTPVVTDLPASVPFVGPEAQERARGTAFAARLGANESGFGPSPRALMAMADAAAEAWMYGDPECHDLRRALAKSHGVAPENVVVGAGIDGLLGTLARLVVAPGTPVVTSHGGYPTFAYHVRAQGGALHEVAYRNDHADLGALAQAARDTGARLVYLANPDNPMGTWHRAAEVQAFLDALPEDCAVALDEAYVDFAPAGAAPLFDLSDARVIRFRTFSKAHGLAGLRVGYAVGAAPTIRAFDKVRDHFGVGRVAQAGALAAARDTEWLSNVVSRTEAARARIGEIVIAHGLVPLPSATNFVAVNCGGNGERARAILSGLIARGIFVRMPAVAPLDRCIRVTAGPDDVLDVFSEALADTLAQT